MTDALRMGSAHAEAAWKNVADTTARERRGIPSRIGVSGNNAQFHEVVKVGHGFTVGQYIGRSGSDWVLASTDSTYDGLLFVYQVVNADRVIGVLRGRVHVPELAYTDFTRYFLAKTPAGEATATAPTVYATDGRARVVHYALSDGWIDVVGFYSTIDHMHYLSEMGDVDHDPPPSDGQVLIWNAADTVYRPTTASALGVLAGISVFGRSANTPGAGAAITATTTGQVLRMGATALEWAQLQTASYEDASVTLAKIENLAAISVLGRAANTSGVMAAITASTTGDVLQMGASALTWGQLQTASYAASSVTLAKIQDLAGISVLGRAANTTGVMAAITATTTGQLLKMGASSLAWGTADTASITDLAVTTAKIADLNVTTAKIADVNVTTAKIADLNVTTAKIAANAVTTAKMDALIVAGGPTGSASVVPVITWDASGRLTAVTTATITAAGIGASSTSHTHTLDSGSNVTITTATAGDFLKWNGSAWVNYNLGPIGYSTGSGTAAEDANVFYFGNTTLGTSMNVAVANGSRLLIDDASSLEFLVRGTVAATTDKWAKIAATSNVGVLFYDDASEVMRWTTNATAGSRLFEIKIPLTINKATTINSAAFTVSGGATTLGTLAATTTDISGTLTCTGAAVISGSGQNLGFFGSSGGTKQTVSGSRGGNAALASLLTALASHGLITNSSSA